MINKISCIFGNSAPVHFVDDLKSLGASLIVINQVDTNYHLDIYVKDAEYLDILDICLECCHIVSVLNTVQDFSEDYDFYLHQMNNFRKLYGRK